jgi:hypothetical protein
LPFTRAKPVGLKHGTVYFDATRAPA